MRAECDDGRGYTAPRRAKDGKERAVPGYWEEWHDAWLRGFDGVLVDGAGTTKSVSEMMEAEVDEAAVDRSDDNPNGG